jgi:hypothetical protein
VHLLEKLACGLGAPAQIGQPFSDIGSVSAGKKRGFCQLTLRGLGGMSSARVYGYHTCLFSQAAPKLSLVASRFPQHWSISGFHGRSHQVG